MIFLYLFTSLAFFSYTQAQTTRPYSCVNNANICQNMCYYMTCLHPDLQVFTRSSLAADKRDRRIACGVTHCPHVCLRNDLFPDLSSPTNNSPDEFPFASFVEGGRTPTGDGASLLCVPKTEQNSQGAKVTNMFGNDLIPQGATMSILMTNTQGIPWCDSSLPVTYDSTTFNGFHYYDTEDVYCAWNVNTNVPDDQVLCVDGQTGTYVQMPGSMRKRQEEQAMNPMMPNYTNLFHHGSPELSELDWDVV